MKRSTILALALILVTALAGTRVAHGQPSPDQPKPDDKKAEPTILGGWRAQSMSLALTEGKRRGFSAEDGAVSVIISDKAFTLRLGTKIFADMSYTVDPKQDPATVELKSEEGTMLGVYKLDGNRLRMALNDAAQGRPKELSPETHGLDLLLVRADGGPLWIINADGSGARQFYAAADYADCGSPAWSPDGGKIVFDCVRSLFGEAAPNTRIMLLDPAGGAAQDVAAGARPSWLPDGKRICFSSYGPPGGACTMKTDGSDIQQLDDPGGFGVKWSPKGDEYAYALDTNLCIRNQKTNQTRTLLDRQYQRVWYGFSWSPDGQWIAFMATLANNQEIAVVHREGEAKGFRTLLTRESMADYLGANNFVAWEPGEGKRILATLVMRSNRNRQLYLLDAEGKSPPQRIAGQDPTRACVNGAWSPDGKRIVFCIRPGATPQP